MEKVIKTGLYTWLKKPGQDFSEVKKLTVPSQSMTLKEILRRFTKREPIGVSSQEAVYESRFVDLEKLNHADITEKMEFVEQVKKATTKRRQLLEEKEAADKAAMEKAALEKREAELRAEGARSVSKDQIPDNSK